MLTTYKIVRKGDKKELPFTYNKIRSSNDLNLYIQNSDVKKFIKESVGKNKPEMDNNTWIFILLKGKVIGLIIMKNTNTINYIYINQKIFKKGQATQAINSVICSEFKDKETPRISIDTTQETPQLIKRYTDYGFKIVRDNQKTTVMEFKCK